MITLVDPAPQPEQRRVAAALIILLSFAVPAFVLSLAAAVLELKAVSEVKGAWNAKEAKEMGMTIQIGAPAYC